jgi:hypothetical protein
MNSKTADFVFKVDKVHIALIVGGDRIVVELEALRLEKAYCTLNTDIPDLNDITCIVQPLVYMVQLYTMLLNRAKVINDSEKEYPAAYSAALDYIAENYKNNISLRYLIFLLVDKMNF